MQAGASLDEASSNVLLTALFFGDVSGVTALGEGVFRVDLSTNETLGMGESVRRSVQGGSTIIILTAGPQAVRTAGARRAALRQSLVFEEQATALSTTASASAMRARVLANIAESRAARAASRFDVFAAREGQIRFGNATASAIPIARRFVRAEEFAAIQAAIANNRQTVMLGRFFTPDRIVDPNVATMQLALPGTSAVPIVGYVDVPLSALPSQPLIRFGPRLVQPFRGNDLIGLPGGGLELELMIAPEVATESILLVPLP
jgi:hypothetical protein